MKNHEFRNGRLIQINKRFSQLKMTQKEWINSLLKEKYIEAYQVNRKKPTNEDRDHILDVVYNAIEEKGIWIPKYEVKQYFSTKINSYSKSFIKS